VLAETTEVKKEADASLMVGKCMKTVGCTKMCLPNKKHAGFCVVNGKAVKNDKPEVKEADALERVKRERKVVKSETPNTTESKSSLGKRPIGTPVKPINMSAADKLRAELEQAEKDEIAIAKKKKKMEADLLKTIAQEEQENKNELNRLKMTAISALAAYKAHPLYEQMKEEKKTKGETSTTELI